MKKILFFFFLILLIILYTFLNDSYRYSIEAKAFYSMGKYEKAYKLANEAYELNRYNKMAFTILTQSKIALVWENFIKQSNEYFIKIESISNKETITKDDKLRIKMMLEIIIGEYNNLPHSKLLNKSLAKQALKIQKKAKELYNGIFKKTT